MNTNKKFLHFIGFIFIMFSLIFVNIILFTFSKKVLLGIIKKFSNKNNEKKEIIYQNIDTNQIFPQNELTLENLGIENIIYDSNPNLKLHNKYLATNSIDKLYSNFKFLTVKDYNEMKNTTNTFRQPNINIDEAKGRIPIDPIFENREINNTDVKNYTKILNNSEITNFPIEKIHHNNINSANNSHTDNITEKNPHVANNSQIYNITENINTTIIINATLTYNKTDIIVLNNQTIVSETRNISAEENIKNEEDQKLKNRNKNRNKNLKHKKNKGKKNKDQMHRKFLEAIEVSNIDSNMIMEIKDYLQTNDLKSKLLQEQNLNEIVTLNKLENQTLNKLVLNEFNENKNEKILSFFASILSIFLFSAICLLVNEIRKNNQQTSEKEHEMEKKFDYHLLDDEETQCSSFNYGIKEI